MMRLIGALILTYFLSRALRWSGLKPPGVTKLVAAHVLSFAILVLLALALRYPTDTFRVEQIWIYVLAQGVWLLFDLYRAQVAFWKPPVTPATESSPGARAGSSR